MHQTAAQAGCEGVGETIFRKCNRCIDFRSADSFHRDETILRIDKQLPDDLAVRAH
jgi:hypothetical protein